MQLDREKMKALRIAKKMTQAHMAEMLGYKSAVGYCRLETGARQVRVEQLPIIAAILEVEIADLFSPGGAA